MGTALMTNEGFLRMLNAKSAAGRIPVSGGMDLTTRCNLRCVHCYFPQSRHDAEPGKQEVFDWIDAAVEMGCLFFLFTGGEPLVRDDFESIYEHAKLSGLLVTLFTNGTLITSRIADCLADLPPQLVEISIYGASARCHDKVTGVRGSFERMLAGLDMLRERGVSVGLKTMLMRPNIGEFEAMLELACDRNVSFRMDSALFPRTDGDMTPVRLRVSPFDAVDKEMKIPGRVESWNKFLAKHGSSVSSSDLYECAAGQTFFHIDAYGFLKPCLMVDNPQVDLRKHHFADAWRDGLLEIVDRKAGPDSPCNNCGSRMVCDSCPGLFKMETGKERKPSEYICETGKQRNSSLRVTT